MEQILIDKLDYCKKELANKIDKTYNKIYEVSCIIEESFLFESQSRKFGNYLLDSKISIYECVLRFQNIIYDELNEINSFKYISDDIDDVLSEYGSLYCGDGILYYNDTLISYNDEQFLQIILNHIIHYSGERFLIKEYKNSTKSLVLLSLYHLGFIDSKIKYSLSCRKELYDDFIKDKSDNNLIIFNPKESLKNFIIKNKISTNFYRVNDKYIEGVRIQISEYGLSFSSYTTKPKELREKNFICYEEIYLKTKYKKQNKIYNKYSNIYSNFYKMYKMN